MRVRHVLRQVTSGSCWMSAYKKKNPAELAA